jgi:Icc-related predicted phosphoesterase
MLILASADLHGSRPVYRWVAAQARRHRPQAIVLAGDLFGFPDGFDSVEAAQADDAAALERELSGLGIPVLYIAGNDDFIDWHASGDGFTDLHARRACVAGQAFVGYHFTPPFVGSCHEKPAAAIADDLRALEPLLDSRTVLVTHGPPRESPAGGPGSWPHPDGGLARLLERRPVRAHIHGHSHAAFGRYGRRFNVAAAARRRGMLIDLGQLTARILEEPPGDP